MPSSTQARPFRLRFRAQPPRYVLARTITGLFFGLSSPRFPPFIARLLLFVRRFIGLHFIRSVSPAYLRFETPLIRHDPLWSSPSLLFLTLAPVRCVVSLRRPGRGSKCSPHCFALHVWSPPARARGPRPLPDALPARINVPFLHLRTSQRLAAAPAGGPFVSLAPMHTASLACVSFQSSLMPLYWALLLPRLAFPTGAPFSFRLEGTLFTSRLSALRFFLLALTWLRLSPSHRVEIHCSHSIRVS